MGGRMQSVDEEKVPCIKPRAILRWREELKTFLIRGGPTIDHTQQTLPFVKRKVKYKESILFQSRKMNTAQERRVVEDTED